MFPQQSNGKSKNGHLSDSAMNIALKKIDHGLEHFVIHDFRRTMRTQLAALQIPPHICERCVNHKIQGVEGVYDRYGYFAERKQALNTWAGVLASLEDGKKLVPIGRKRTKTN